MATRGRSARIKGHTFERSMAQLFRDLGWSKCVTSRSESKNLDDLGIDLCYTSPFQVQCKAVEGTVPMHDLLPSMPKGLNIVLHKRNDKGVTATMSLESFIFVIGLLKDYGAILKETV